MWLGRWIVGMLALIVPVGVALGESVDGLKEMQAEIQWLAWSDQAFERAQREDKLILLDLMTVWCHACHVMEETTYADPAVIRLITERFVPIRVDSDQRPDIDLRYRSGGWPTTSILLPTGEVLFEANALQPAELLDVLQELDRVYREHRDELHQHAAEIWAQAQTNRASTAIRDGAIEPSVILQSMMIMSRLFDPIYGGFRDKPKFFEPEAITLAFLLAHDRQDPDMLRMAVLTLDQQQKLVDPVWGGFYRYAEERDWTKPHYEKILAIQAANLWNYLEAYQATKSIRYKTVAEGILSYVFRFLADRERGGFYASQDSDVRIRGPKPRVIQGDDYFALDDRQRRAIGIPSVDRTIYVGWNGQMAKSLFYAFHVLDDDEAKTVALRTLDHVYDHGYRPNRGMVHALFGEHAQEMSFLSDQVWFADALLAAYLATDEGRYLTRAERLVTDLVSRFEDREVGGFYDHGGTVEGRGLLRIPEKPLRLNLQAVLLFCDLYYVTEQAQYRDLADRTLRFVLGDSRPHPVAYTALATHRFLHYPVHIVVVGDRLHPMTTRLFRAAHRVYFPGKIVQLLDPERESLEVGRVSFPRLESPRAYVCTDRVCSPPLSQPQELHKAVHEVASLASSPALPELKP